mmetsp:Transcript_23763/g.61735  ORF Transcript_23763/g.61735 Transcript_23763/m.61735 type:complete len:331 (-) Transcript_23763:903-1895(-)
MVKHGVGVVGHIRVGAVGQRDGDHEVEGERRGEAAHQRGVHEQGVRGCVARHQHEVLRLPEAEEAEVGADDRVGQAEHADQHGLQQPGVVLHQLRKDGQVGQQRRDGRLRYHNAQRQEAGEQRSGAEQERLDPAAPPPFPVPRQRGGQPRHLVATARRARLEAHPLAVAVVQHVLQLHVPVRRLGVARHAAFPLLDGAAHLALEPRQLPSAQKVVVHIRILAQLHLRLAQVQRIRGRQRVPRHRLDPLHMPFQGISATEEAVGVGGHPLALEEFPLGLQRIGVVDADAVVHGLVDGVQVGEVPQALWDLHHAVRHEKQAQEQANRVAGGC